MAATLCGAAFDPEVTTSWLQSLIVTNVAMMGPANRLLRYSGTPEVCPRLPTDAERDFYVAEVYARPRTGPALPPRSHGGSCPRPGHRLRPPGHPWFR